MEIPKNYLPNPNHHQQAKPPFGGWWLFKEHRKALPPGNFLHKTRH